MKTGMNATRAAAGILSLTALTGIFPCHAQDWADAHYRYRKPLTITTGVPEGLDAGTVVAFPFIPNYGPFNGKTRADGKDIKIIYYNGSANVEPAQVMLPMGPASARVLIALQSAVPALPPYNLVENPNAGKTDYDTLAKGPALAFPASATYPLDDNTVTVTLPFTFSLRDSTSNKITIAIDGYVGVGAVDPGRPSDVKTGSDKYILMPFQSDFAILGTGQGVFYSADSTQAVIKWELQETATEAGPLIAKFACVIKPDGTIRFVYGSPCNAPSEAVASPDFGYNPIRYGVGVNDPSSPITAPVWDPFTGVDFSAHSDIVYTQTLPVSTITGYWAYYGNPADTGVRSAPTTGIQGCDFSDGALHGWESLQDPAGTGGASADVRMSSSTTFGNELRFDASKYHHPLMYWKTMTPLARGISYSKLRRAGEFAVVQRFNTQTLTSSDPGIGDYITGADIPGVGINWNAWGGAYPMVSTIQADEEPGTGKRHPGPDGMAGTIRYRMDDENAYQYQIEATTDDAITGHTLVKARGWPSVDQFIPTDPGTWIVSGDSAGKVPAPQPLPEGKMAIMMYGGTMYVKSVYVVSNPYAEDMSYTAGTESIMPPPANKGTLQGTVIDAVTMAGIPGVIVTMTPQGGGTVVTSGTDSAGTYVSYVDPGTYNVKFVYAGYNAATIAGGAVTIGGVQTVNASLVAYNMLSNAGFETADSPFTGKPKSWYRRNLGNNGDPPASSSAFPWEYTSIGAHTGSKTLGISSSSGIAAWELEGNVAGVNNADNRGKGSLPAVIVGDTYRASVWMRKSGGGGVGRIVGQPMSGLSDADANVAAGAQYADLATDTGGAWVQVSRDLTATGPYMNVRLYGVDIPFNQHVYVDDVSLTRVQTPVFNRVVQDTAGNPVAFAGVGLRENAANGMACPLLSATTDAVGRFSLSFVPTPGTSYVVQAWKDGYGASSNTPLGAPGATTVVTYDATPFANVSVVKTIVAASGDDNGGGRVANAFDGNEDTRWINGVANPVGNATGSSNPAWIVVDLGQSVPIAQISMIWEAAKAGAYQIRVSNTAPGAGFDAAAAAAYGTQIYSTTTGANAYTPPGAPSKRVDVLTQPSIPSNASGRYVELYMSAFGAFGNYSLYEMKVEVPVGTVTGRALDSATLQPIANAFVGPYPFIRIRPWTSSVYVKTDATGVFVYPGASIPTLLAIHKAADTQPLAADPYVIRTVTLTPSLAAANAGDILLQPNADTDGNALRAGTTIVIDNAANPGAEIYLPTTASDVGNPPNVPDQATDGDASKPWDINTSNTIPGKIHHITEGTGYLRFGLQNTLAVPANLIAVDFYWWQNGYPMSYYVEVQRPGSSTWERVYEIKAQSGGYGTRDDSGNDNWTVNPIRFPVRPVAKVRVIFTKDSERSYGGDYGSEVLLGELYALSSTAPSRTDVIQALRVAGGLEAGPASGSETFTKLNQVTTGASSGKIDVADAIALAKLEQ